MSILFHRIQQLSRDINQYLNQSLADESIYMSHWAVIFQLKQHGRMTQAGLKDRLNIEAPSLSRTIRKLEELGYVTKLVSKDKRTNDLVLTQESEENFARWQEAIQEAEKHLLDQLGEKQEKEFESYVIALTKAIKGESQNGI